MKIILAEVNLVSIFFVSFFTRFNDKKCMTLLLKYLKFINANAKKYLKQYNKEFNVLDLSFVLNNTLGNVEVLLQIYQLFKNIYELHDERYKKYRQKKLFSIFFIFLSVGFFLDSLKIKLFVWYKI